MKFLLVYSPFTYPLSPPVGISYLKGFVNDHFPEINVKCLDLNVDWYKDNGINDIKDSLDCFEEEDSFQRQIQKYLKNGTLTEDLLKNLNKDLNKINEFNPNIIGFSVLMKSQLPYSLALAKLIKKKNKKIKIVFGGGLFLFGSLPDCDKLILPSNPVDYLIKGAGEYSLYALLKKLQGDKRIKLNTPFTIYYGLKKEEITKIKSQTSKSKSKKPFIFNSLPDYKDFDLAKYPVSNISLPVQVARGCTWNRCTFCQSSVSKFGFIAKDIRKIIKEIKFLKKEFGVSHFYFIAPEVPAFLLDKIAGALIKSRLKIRYSIYARPIPSFNIKLLKKAYKSGCRLIDYGVESFSQRILDLMDKGTNTKDILSLLKRTKEAKIKTFCWYIIGFPSHTVREVKKEIEIIKENAKYIDFLSLGMFFLRKRSLVYNNKELILKKKSNRSLLLEINKTKIFDDEMISFDSLSGMSQRQVQKWSRSMFEEFMQLKKKNNKNHYRLATKLRESYILQDK